MWKYRFGFSLVDYDKDEKYTLVEILTDLQPRAVERDDRLYYRGAKGAPGGYVKGIIWDEDEKYYHFIQEGQLRKVPKKSPIDKALDIVKDERWAIVALDSSKRFQNKHDKSFAELVFMIKEKDGWKIDLERTFRERGLVQNLEKMEAEQSGKKKKDGDGGGCVMTSGNMTTAQGWGVMLPFLVLILGLFWVGRWRLYH